MKKQNKPILLILLLAFFVTACGESSSNLASGGIGGTGISQGTITGFGSVILNGEKFNTDGTTFTIDDNQTGTSQADLAIGMQVKVQVDATGNTATAIVFEPEVEGPIDAVDTANNALTVLGRTVVIDDNTKIEDSAGTAIPGGITGLTTDDMLQVSGLVLVDDKVQATHIKKEDNGFVAGVTELELKARITSVSDDPETLVIAGQTVDYSGSTFEGMTKGELAADLLIEVKGTRGAAGTTMTATRIQKEDGTLGAANTNKLEIEGLVTTVGASSSAFSVSGQSVSTSASTTFEGGVADDILLNVRLEVEGTLTNDVLVATKVKFHGNRIKIEADVEAKETDTSKPNSVTVLGKKVIINGLTRQDGVSYSGITVEDRLEIRGYLSNGVITATRVRAGEVGEILLQAPIEALANPDLTLLGKTVKTTGAIFKDSTGEGETGIDSPTFFSQVKVGSVIKVKGTLSGTDINATEVEIEIK